MEFDTPLVKYLLLIFYHRKVSRWVAFQISSGVPLKKVLEEIALIQVFSPVKDLGQSTRNLFSNWSADLVFCKARLCINSLRLTT